MKNIKVRSSITLLVFLLVWSCQSTDKKAIKLQQYQIHGKDLYELHCTNCHQPDGSGLGLLIPPIDSLFLAENQNLIICGIKNGMRGPITVNGKKYDREMPANPRLTPLEIAELMTYLQTEWANKDSIVDISAVQKAINSCK